jgi:hypothetical protein
MTASPTLARVVEDHFSLFSRASCARLRRERFRSRRLKTVQRRRILKRFPKTTVRELRVKAFVIS